MAGILVELLVFLGILFLLVLIISPIIYYFNKDKAEETEAKDAKEAARSKPKGDGGGG